jgi:hypothetical protein
MDYSQPRQTHGLKPKGSNHGSRAVGMKHLPRGVEDVVDGARDDARVGVGVVRGECLAAAGLPIGEIHPVDGGGREGGSSPSGRSTTVGRWSCSAAGRSVAPPHLIWMWGGGGEEEEEPTMSTRGVVARRWGWGWRTAATQTEAEHAT